MNLIIIVAVIVILFTIQRVYRIASIKGYEEYNIEFSYKIYMYAYA